MIEIQSSPRHLILATTRIHVKCNERYMRQCLAARDSVPRCKRVVHGHFSIRKYDGISAPRVIILRDPVDRLISHYWFWKQIPPHGHSLHDRFLAQQPTITEFARWPGLRHFYQRVMFRDVEKGVFDLFGSMEELREAI